MAVTTAVEDRLVLAARRGWTTVRPPQPPAPGRASMTRLYAVWFLLIASLVAWRNGVYYSGGLDPTVVAKALIGFVAAALAAGAAMRNPQRPDLRSRTLTLIAVYLAITVIGGLVGGSLVASTILAIRVLLVAVTVAFARLGWDRDRFLTSAMTSLATAGLIAAASGLGDLVRGRLAGGLIPVQANQLALLFGPPTIWLAWRQAQGIGRRLPQASVLGLLLVLTYLTGARTGLAALVVGVLVVLWLGHRLPVGGFVALTLATPVALYLFAGTDLVGSFISRQGTGNVETLNSRTVAWGAALHSASGAERILFGGGLAVKTVAVTGTYWNSQVLDSSWASALVQGGALAVAVLAVFAVSALVAAVRADGPLRPVLVALVLYALIQSTLENGLIDTYVLFVVALIPCLLTETEPRSVRWSVTRPVAPPIARRPSAMQRI